MQLNKSIRETILKNLIHDSFSKEEKELENKKTEIVESMYFDKYKDILPIIESLPNGILLTSTWLRFNCNGIYPSNEHFKWMFKSSKRVAYRGRYLDFSYGEDHPYTLEVMRLLEDEKNLKNRKQKASLTAEGILNSVKTLEQLITAWPEIEPYTINIKAPVKSNLPALNIKDANNLLGLPKAS